MAMLNQPALPAKYRHGLSGCEPSPGLTPFATLLLAALD
jgi:hypothetical protein